MLAGQRGDSSVGNDLEPQKQVHKQFDFLDNGKRWMKKANLAKRKSIALMITFHFQQAVETVLGRIFP